VRDRHVLITGGSQGIGSHLAREVAMRGARVTLVARSSGKLQAMADEVGGAALPRDLSDPASHHGLIDAAEQLNGPVDVLVNNAGVGATVHFAALTADQVLGGVTVNLLAPMELTRQALPGMLARKQGTIANISSVSGELAVPNVPIYGTTKAGLMMMSLSLMRDLNKTDIHTLCYVIGAAPGTGIYDEGQINPVTRAVSERFKKFATLQPETVARRIADTLDSRRDRVIVMPRTIEPLVRLHQLPHLLGSLIFNSIDPRPPNASPAIGAEHTDRES
jgi:short-subunit dehydrogenase